MAKRYVQQWEVQSHSDPDKYYVVSLTAEGAYECSCPHWIFRTPRPECKHIKQVKAGNYAYTQVIESEEEQQRRAETFLRGARRSRFGFVTANCGE